MSGAAQSRKDNAAQKEFKVYSVAVRWLVKSLSLKMKVENPALACCEYVIAFTDDKKKSEDLPTYIEFLKTQFIKRGLVILVKESAATHKTIMLVSGTPQMFYDDAESMKLMKKLNDGEEVDFKAATKELFPGSNNVQKFFTSSERQQMIRNRIYGVVLKEADKKGSLQSLKIDIGEGVVRTLMEEGYIEQIYALHDDDLLQTLRVAWMNESYRSIIAKMRDYFGEEIAFYFAWLAFYNKMLLLPAMFALAIWIFQFFSTREGMPVVIIFALMLSLWATLFIEFWKRTSSEYAFLWDVMEYEEEEPQRAEFKGERKKDPITGELKKFDDTKKRYTRYAMSYGLVMMTLIIPVTMLAVMNHFIFLWKDEPYLSYVPMVVHPIFVLVASKLYRMLADWLNEVENHETDSSFQNHLVIKLLLFEFPNRFMSLFYTAFYIGDMELLQSELIAFFVIEQLTNNVQEYIIPFVLIQFNKWRSGAFDSKAKKPSANADPTIVPDLKFSPDDFKDISKGQTSPGFMEKVEKELEQDPYPTTFDDYWEMVLQFGYVTCFATAAPVAAFFALANNIIEWHGDAFKLLFLHKRPDPRRAAGIGVWLQTLEFFSYVAVITNCGLCYYTSPQLGQLFPNVGKEALFLCVLLVEHLLIAFKSVLAIAIPDVPEHITNEIKRREFLSKKREEELKMDKARQNLLESSPTGTPEASSASIKTVHEAARLMRRKKANKE